MKGLARFLKAHKTLVISMGFLVAFSITVTYATPPTSPYDAGATLDPSCAPGETNCTVSIGGGGGLNPDGTILAYDTISANTPVPDLGDSARLMWYPSVEAFRAGEAFGTGWDSANVGQWSAAFGQGTVASGTASFAAGSIAHATGYASLALGNVTTASGFASVALGANTTASGNNSLAVGNNTTASGFISVALGNQTHATANFSAAFNDTTHATGNASASFGEQTTASGEASFALGNASIAAGDFSLSGGTQTHADSFASTALGSNNIGGGDAHNWVGTDPLFEIGNSNTGTASDALLVLKNGDTTVGGALTVTGNLHVTGLITCAGGCSGSGGGSNADGTILAYDSNASNTPVPDLGAGSRLMWYPSASAFRAGNVSGDQWDSANIGQYSAAFGADTTASGDNSFAAGTDSIASGQYSVALGNGASASGYSAISFGGGIASGQWSTAYAFATASGSFSFGIGNGSIADGQASFAGGDTTSALGQNSFAFGSNSTASAYDSVAFGENNQATANYAVAFGTGSTASGLYSTAFGGASIASGVNSTAVNGGWAFGDSSFASGGNVIASAYASTAFGSYNVGGGDGTTWIATDPLFEIGNGDPSVGTLSDALLVLKNGNTTIGGDLHVTGNLSCDGGSCGLNISGSGAFSAVLNQENTENISSGNYSTTTGNQTTASGLHSFAGGYFSTASGDTSFAMGESTVSSGDFSTAFGVGAAGLGSSSIATGWYTHAIGDRSSAFGDFTVADAYDAAVFGRVNIGFSNNSAPADPSNWIATDPLFEVGDGDINTGIGSDALMILKNGYAGFGLDPASPYPMVQLQVGSSLLTDTIVAHFENSAGTCDLDPLQTGGLSCTSDMNAKKNINLLADNTAWNFNSNVTADNQSVLARVMALTPVTYNFKTESDTDEKHAGFIAQEVEQIFPDLVTTGSNGKKTLNYTGLVPYTVEAIKEMNLNIANLDDLTKTNTWRDSITNWLADSANGITNIFSKQVTTPTLCVGTDTNKTCITKDQLDHLLQAQGMNGTSGGSSAPADAPSDSSDANTQSEQVTPPVVVDPVETPPADDAAAQVQDPAPADNSSTATDTPAN